MKKIPSLFVRDWNGNRALVTPEIDPECRWVMDAVENAAVPTWKRDGTACIYRDGQLLKRYDAKGGKTPPPGFEPCQDPDPITGHWPGWVPIGPDDKWHVWAFYNLYGGELGGGPGTYELCGPALQTNPEKLTTYQFFKHGVEVLKDAPPAGQLCHGVISAYLEARQIEGIVWHHPDGRMAKIKRTDFGHKWPT